MIEHRLVVCAMCSIAGHLALGRSVAELPPRAAIVRPRTVELRVLPAPPPPPEREPDPPPEPPPKRVHEARTPPVRAVVQAETPTEAPPTEDPTPAIETTTQPTFGVTMESTSQAAGPAVPVGNSTRPGPSTADAPAPLAAPVAGYEVTKMPMPQGRCAGRYTDAAREAALEGTVVLDLVVDEHGRARDLTVVEGLGHGLTEAAIAALAACRFTPGEKAGVPVPVRVRGFKIRFFLQESR